MSELDSLPEQFERILEGIRTNYPLEEWRYAYRKVIYAGAMRILKDFPEIIVGPPPALPQVQEQRGPTYGGGAQIGGGHNPPPKFIDGQKPPYRPSAIIELVCIASGNCPPAQS
ncbi:MAG: hypothetical protein ABI356_10340 [Steroidobacteraceae bacterium]